MNQMLAAGRWQGTQPRVPLIDRNTPAWIERHPRVSAQLEELGFPQQRFHDLRHCTASILLAEGMDLFTVKEVLGTRRSA